MPKIKEETPLMKVEGPWMTLLVVLGVLAILLAFSFFVTMKAGAFFVPKVNVCHCERPDGDNPFQCQTLNVAVPAAIAHLTQHDADYAGSCQIEEPTPAPTVTPTPTPVDEDKCDEGYIEVDEQCVPDEVPTPTPTDIPGPGFPQPQLGTGEGSLAPKCSEPAPVVQPRNVNVVRNGSVANVAWIPGDESVIDIFYTEGKRTDNASSWPHALIVEYWKHAIQGQATIGGLNPSLDYSFALRSRNACSGGEFVYQVVVDGPANGVFFPLTTWYLAK